MHEAFEQDPSEALAGPTFEDNASRPLIVPMPETRTWFLVAAVGVLLGSVALGVVAMAALPSPKGAALGPLFWVIGAVIAVWLVGISTLLVLQRRDLGRVIRRFERQPTDGSLSHEAMARLVSRAMGARGCRKGEFNKWRRRDFDRLRNAVGPSLPLVWSIDGFESDWLARLLAEPAAEVNASVSPSRSLLGAVRADLPGIASIIALVMIGLIGVVQGWPRWLIIGSLLGVTGVLYLALRLVLGHAQWWLHRDPEGLALMRTSHSGNVVRAMPVDPDALVIIAPVYEIQRGRTRIIAVQDPDLLEIHVLPPAGQRAFRLQPPREDGMTPSEPDAGMPDESDAGP